MLKDTATRDALNERFDEWCDDYFAHVDVVSPNGRQLLWLKNAYLAGATAAATDFDFCHTIQRLAAKLGVPS